MLMSYRISPLLMTITIVCKLALGPLAALSTKHLGALVNEATAAYGTNALSGVFRELLFVLGAAVVIAITQIVSAACEGKVRIKLEKTVRANIMRIASRTDYLTFLSEEFQKDVNMADEGFAQSLLSSFSSPFEILSSAAALISYLILVTETVGYYAVAAAAVTIAAAITTKAFSSNSSIKLFRSNRNLRLRFLYADSLYYHPDVYAEMKLFGTKNELDLHYADLYETYNSEQFRVQIKHTRHDLILAAVMASVALASILLCFVGGRIKDAGMLTVVVASFIAILQKSAVLAERLLGLNDLGRHAKEYIKFIEKYDSGSDNAEPTDCKDYTDIIDVRGLTFSYGNIRVLNGIDLQVHSGQMVALVGENGSGKTTLANIILGLLAKGGGVARVFGRDAYAARKTGALDSVAVFQNFGKYDGHMVAENIAFGEKIDASVRNASDDFIAGLDLNETVGNEFDGRDFSGGEWQKIVLARCTTSKAPLIILDEPTAALDPMAEAEVFDRFMEANRGKTAVLITHRLGAVRKADVIFVLKDGVIEERGTHDELMQRNGYYSEMFRAQAQWYVTDGGEGGDAQ